MRASCSRMPSGQRMLRPSAGSAKSAGIFASTLAWFTSTEEPDSTTSVTHLNAMSRYSGCWIAFKCVTDVEVVLHVRRVEYRDQAGLENVLGLVRQGRGLRRVIVAREHQDAAVPRRAGGVGVLEHVAAAVDARPLAVPHAVDAVVFRAGEEVHRLRAPDRSRRQVLVDAGLELDVVALEMLLRAPQRLVEPAERRAAVARDEAGGIEAGSGVALALQQHQADQRLRAGEEDAAALQRVLVVERGFRQVCRGAHVLPFSTAIRQRREP